MRLFQSVGFPRECIGSARRIAANVFISSARFQHLSADDEFRPCHRIKNGLARAGGWAVVRLDDLSYCGHGVSVVWDRDGTRYRPGPRLHLHVDGKQVASSDTLGVLSAKLLASASEPARKPVVNYFVAMTAITSHR